MSLPVNEENQVTEFGNKELVELFIILPLLSILFLLFIFKFDAYFPNSKEIKGAIFWFIWGLIHIFASNILSALYNLQFIILRIGPIIKPFMLKVLGIGAIANSIIIGYPFF